MEKTLYVSDLDGTLLTPESRISPQSLEILNNLIDKGMCFTYATARSLTSASKVAQGLTVRAPVIVYNGAFLLDPRTGQRLVSQLFAPREVQAAAAILFSCGLSPTVDAYIAGELKKSWVMSRENEGVRHFIQSRPADPRMRPLPSAEGLYDGDVFYFTCIGAREDLLPAWERFRHDERFTCTFQQEIYRPEFWLEIMPRKATKANAIIKLKGLLGCTRVVSFGDAVNDIPLFRVSDECYAVANAVNALKEIATGVIGGNDADGVARWLLARAQAGNL